METMADGSPQPTPDPMDNNSLFRQKPSSNTPRGQDQSAVDAVPSEQSGTRTVATRPVWEKFVTNTVAQENNRAVVQAENDLIRKAEQSNRTAESAVKWGGGNGRLFRKEGRNIEEFDAEQYGDDPEVGVFARKSIWDKDKRKAAADYEAASLALQNPSFKGKDKELSKKARADIEAESKFLQESDPRHVELKAKLVADTEYQTRKAELENQAYQSKVRAFQIEQTDPDSYWQSRKQQAGAPSPADLRAEAVQASQSLREEAEAADQSAVVEEQALRGEMSQGVTASRSTEIKSRLAEIGQARALVGEKKIEAQAGIEAVKAQAKAKRSFAPEFAGTIAQSGLSASLGGAIETGNFNNLKRKADGDWDLPAMVPITEDSGLLDKAGAALVGISQKMGEGLEKSEIFTDTKAIQKVFHDFQQANNLSDEEMDATWQDYLKATKTWKGEEKARTFSDGRVELNPLSREFLDTEKAKRLLDEAGASPEAKAAYLEALPDRQFNVSSNKLETYEAAATAARVMQYTPGGAAVRAADGAFLTPSEYGKQTGRNAAELATPEFILEYEREVIDKQGDMGKYVRGLTVDALLGWNKVATLGLGLGGFAGSDNAADLAAQSSEIASTIGQGKADTGLVGAVMQETPSILTQVVASQLTGGMALLATGGRGASAIGTTSALLNAGAQSAGLIYASERAEGKTDGEARKNATIAGVNTAIITGVFQKLGAGGVETVAAGKKVSEVTIRDLLAAGSKKEVLDGTRKFAAQMLKSYFGEASEEAIDEYTQTFLTADPDSNLADAWSNAWEAFKIGGVMGGVTGVVSSIGEKPTAPAAPERVNTALAAIDPELPPATPEEIAAARMTANPSDGAQGIAESVLIERELAAVEAEDAETMADAERQMDFARQSGDATAIRAAQDELDAYKQRTNRAPAVRAVLKIAAGQQLDDLTPEELRSIGAKTVKDGFEPMTAKELKDVGLESPLIRDGAEDSIVPSDEALIRVAAISIRARARIDASIQKAKQRLSTDTQNGAAAPTGAAASQGVPGDPGTGSQSPGGGVGSPIETNAAVEFDVPMRDGTMLRVQAADGNAALEEAAAQAPISGQPATPVSNVANPNTTGGNPAGTSPAKAQAKDPVNLSDRRRFPEDDDSMEAKVHAAIHSTQGADKRFDALRKSGATDAELNQAISDAFGTYTGSSNFGGWTAKGGKSPNLEAYVLGDGKPPQSVKGKELVAMVRELMQIPQPVNAQKTASGETQTPKALIREPQPGKIAHAAAKARFTKAKKKLGDRLVESKERAITRPDGIRINPTQIIDEALSRGMDDKQAAEYFSRILDEEIRHLAQYDAGKLLYRAEKATGPFLDWMEARYAAIWQSDFVATGKDKIVRDIRAKTETGIDASWDAMSDGDKALEAIRMMSQGDAVTEQAKLWADISESLKKALRAALAALKQFSDIASPTLKSEITNLENALKQLTNSQPRGGNSKTGGGKSAPGKTGDGDRGQAQGEFNSGASVDGGAQPASGDGARPSLVVGAPVEFDGPDGVIQGTIGNLASPGKPEVASLVGGDGIERVRVKFDGTSKAVPVGDLRFLQPPSASTPEGGQDMSHLNALELGLSRARERARTAKTPDEQKSRDLSVRQYEKEIASEREFLGLPKEDAVEMSDEDLLASLTDGDKAVLDAIDSLPTTAEKIPEVSRTVKTKPRRNIDTPARREAFRLINSQDTELIAINKILAGGGKLQSPPSGMLKIIKNLAGSRNLTEKQMAMQRRWNDYNGFQPKNAFGSTFNGKVAQELHGMLFTQDESTASLDDWAGRLGGVTNDEAMLQIMGELDRVARGISRENNPNNPNRELNSEEERQIMAFSEANQWQQGRFDWYPKDIEVGESVTIAGEQFTIISKADGEVFLEDGDKFGTQRLLGNQVIWVDVENSPFLENEEMAANDIIDIAENNGYDSPDEFREAEPEEFARIAAEVFAFERARDESLASVLPDDTGAPQDVQGQGSGRSPQVKRPVSKMDIRNADSKELFGDDGGFKLGQDTTIDGDKVAAERKAKEEAKAAQDAAQRDMFGESPAVATNESSSESNIQRIERHIKTLEYRISQGGSSNVNKKENAARLAELKVELKLANATAKPTLAQDQPSLLEYAKSKVPPSVAAQLTQESQAESFRAQYEKEFGKPSSPALTPDEQALKDAFSGMVDGLEAAPLVADDFYQSKGIPRDKRTLFMDVADQLYDAGVRTPQDLAAKLEKVGGGKLRAYSDAVWSILRSNYPTLPQSSDWAGVYSNLNDTPSNDSTPSTSLEPDSGDAGSQNASGKSGVQSGRKSARGDGKRVVSGGNPSGNPAQDNLQPDDDATPPERGGRDQQSPDPASEPAERPSKPENADGSRVPDASGVEPYGRGESDTHDGLVLPAAASTLAQGGIEGVRDVASVKKSVPALKVEQAEDVVFVEKRFEKEPGALLTNGTGTGKTFSGLGVVKRALDRGEKHIIIIAPSDKVVNDWIDTARDFFGIGDIAQLDGIRDNSSKNRVVVTTYANFGQNNELVARPWGLVVTDEAHYLSQAKDGTSTLAQKTFKGLTWHPKEGVRSRLNMEMAEEIEEMSALRKSIDGNTRLMNRDDTMDQARDAYRRENIELEARWNILNTKVRARGDELMKIAAGMKKEDRPKALFLSATPFAYHFSLDYAEGYLFEHGPEPESRGYNTPSARSRFFIENFGYRMRYGKLTQPENAAATGILERMFAEKLKREGAMRGRMLQVPFDYSRDFILAESQIGTKVDEVIDLIQKEKRFEPLRSQLEVGDYLARRYLLEGLKAREAVKRINEHLALGRKVVVFHDYKKNNATNPLRLVAGDKDAVKAYETLRSEVPGFDNLVTLLDGLMSPIQVIRQAFPDAGFFNGDVPAKQRRENVKAFNQSGGKMNVILAQRAAGKEGISLHDTDAKHQRAFIDLGLPGRPTDAIQSEGRTIRLGMQSNGVIEYLTTGTNFERWTFAQTIATRASTAENLAMGESARSLLQSFSTGYNEARAVRPSKDQGTGGKKADAARESGDPFDNAVALYFTNQKKTSRNKAEEGVDYFATPEPLGFKMVEWAGIRPGERVLEPSGGHGAIARFFPDSTTRHAVEPSYELAGRLALNAPDTKIHQVQFEDYDIINKFDVVVMNPPFGTAGKTAMDHLEKAVRHLKDGGRVVALIPNGSSMAKRFDKWYEAVEGVFMAAEIQLPSVTFERAGTSVSARIVILDKVKADDANQQSNRDFTSAGTTKELFERLKESTVPSRPSPAVEKTPAQMMAELLGGGREALIPKAEKPQGIDGAFSAADFIHTQKGTSVFVARIDNKLSSSEYAAAKSLAKKHGGYYSSYNKGGAIPGFHFPDAESRDGFLGAAGNQDGGLQAAELPSSSSYPSFPLHKSGRTPYVHSNTGVLFPDGHEIQTNTKAPDSLPDGGGEVWNRIRQSKTRGSAIQGAWEASSDGLADADWLVESIALADGSEQPVGTVREFWQWIRATLNGPQFTGIDPVDTLDALAHVLQLESPVSEGSNFQNQLHYVPISDDGTVLAIDNATGKASFGKIPKQGLRADSPEWKAMSKEERMAYLKQRGRDAEKSIGQRENESIESPNNVFGTKWREIAESELEPWHKRAVAVAISSEREAKRPRSDIRAVTPRESNESHILPGRFTRELLRVFRKKVVLVGAVDGKSLGFDGLLSPDDPNTIIIDADAYAGWSYLLGHELGHSIQHQRPDLYRDLSEAILGMASEWGIYNDRLKKDPAYAKSQNRRNAEFVNDFIGSQFGEAKFWRRLYSSNRSVFRELVDFALKYLKSIGGKIEGVDRDVRPYFKDIEAARKVLVKTLEQYQRGDMPAQSVLPPNLTESTDDELLSGGNNSNGLRAGDLPASRDAEPLASFKKRVTVDPALAANSREQQRAFGKNVASGKLASFGNTRSRLEQDIVDAEYEFKKVRKTNEDAMIVAKKRLEAGRDAVEEKLFRAALGEDVALDAADEMAFRYLINERSEQAGNDGNKHAENMKLRMALRLERAEIARRMQIGYDRTMTPAERAQEAITDAIYTPSRKIEKYAEKLTGAKKREFLDKAAKDRIAEVEKTLKKLGLDLAKVTGKNRDLQLENSRLMKEVLKTKNVLEQNIVRMVQKGASLADIKRRFGTLGFEQAQEVITKAREELFAKIDAMAKSGMSREQIREAMKDGLKAAPLDSAANGMTAAEIWNMIEEDFGLPKEIPANSLPTAKPKKTKAEKLIETNPLASDWSRPEFTDGMNSYEFDTKDREGIMERVEVIRGLAGALGKIDGLSGDKRAKAEAALKQIDQILAKYDTDAKGIFEAAQGIEDYGFDINDVAQVAAVSRAISMIDADLVDKASEWLYFSMLSGLQTMLVNATAVVPAAWEVTVGRGVETAINLLVRDPMSAQLGESKYILKAIAPALSRALSNARTSFAAQHPMFDRDVLAKEVDWERVMGGKGYRVGGSIAGKFGDRVRIPMRILAATDDFNTTLMACVEVGTFAYRIAKAKGMKDGSPEMDRFIRIEVNTPGSFSYHLATQNAKSAIFTNPLPGQHDPVSGSKVPVNDLGDAVGYLAGKISETFAKGHDNLFVKTVFAATRIAFFPFQRTPFNILRKGVRYTLNPFSLFDIGLGIVMNSRTADGQWQWNARGRNPELVRRAAMQLQGAILMLLVAGLGEGDEDDQDKPVIITGSAPFSPRGQAEREAAMRSGLGPYRISFRRKDGSERFGFNYGRLEPMATTLAASIDIMKFAKRTLRGGGDASDATGAALGGFVAQAQDKSFLRGLGDFTALVTNALAEPDLKDNRKFQQFIAGRVAMVMPNIIKQPIREADSHFRERSSGFMQELLYSTIPYGQKPAKVDPYGQPVTKTGNPVLRSIDMSDAGTNPVNPVDSMLLRFRDKHPDKAWFPSPIMNAEFKHPKTGQNVKMNAAQLAEFRMQSGKMLSMALRSQSINYENPSESDIEKVKETVSKARSIAKKALSHKFARQ